MKKCYDANFDEVDSSEKDPFLVIESGLSDNGNIYFKYGSGDALFVVGKEDLRRIADDFAPIEKAATSGYAAPVDLSDTDNYKPYTISTSFGQSGSYESELRRWAVEQVMESEDSGSLVGKDITRIIEAAKSLVEYVNPQEKAQ